MTIEGDTALDPSRQSDQLSTGGVPREQELSNPHRLPPARAKPAPRKQHCRICTPDAQTVRPLTACANQLRSHPEINASWGGDKLIRHHYIHIGIAVAVPDGLIVPVIHHADRPVLVVR